MLTSGAWPVACILAAGLAVAPAAAQTSVQKDKPAASSEATANRVANDQDLVNAATGIVKTIKQDPHMAALLVKAKGVFIIPKYGHSSDGGSGRGVVLANNDHGWSDPAFYTYRHINLGPTVQYGSLGSVVLVLMDQHALNAFKAGQAFSIDHKSSLSVADYRRAPESQMAKDDIVMWSDLYRNLSGVPARITGIAWNGAENQAYYGQSVDAGKVIDGSATNAKADALTKVLPG